MGGSISIRTVLATLVATLLLAAAPGARADDLPAVVPTDGAAIAQQAVDATTAPPVQSSAPVPSPETTAPAPEAEATPEPASAPEPVASAPAPKPVAPPPPANLNVNVRVGSEGDDGPVAQTSQDGGNINVSVRIDSPGTTGAVEQASSAQPASSPGAKTATTDAPDVVFHWTWTSACGVSARSVELDWKWSCDQAQAPAVVPTTVAALPGLPALPGPSVAGDPVPIAVPVVLREQVPVPFAVPVATGRGPTGSPPVLLSGASAQTASVSWLPAFAEATSFRVTRTVPPTGAPAFAPPRHHAGGGARRPGPAPISPDIPLPPVALVVASAGGGSGISFVPLLALALLGAVALSGPAGPLMRLASVIQPRRGLGGRRLERPG